MALNSLRVITAPLFISEPVAGRVSTEPNGTVAPTLRPRSSSSCQGSPWKGIAAATNLVPSTTEPPPTASRKSTRSRRARATASIRVS